MREKHKTVRVVLILLAILFLLPCLLLVLPLTGKPLDSLRDTVTSPDYLQGYGNTLTLAIGSVVLQTAVALPAGYVLARNIPRRVRQICLVLCGLLMLLPQQTLMLPQYLVLQKLGLLDTLASLLLVTALQPWMLLLFWFGTSRIDREIFDAAACDGAAGMTFTRRIYLPLMAPYLATAALLSVAESWNLLEQPMIFLQHRTNYPLSVLLSRLPETASSPKIFAEIIYLIPVILIWRLICYKICKYKIL